MTAVADRAADLSHADRLSLEAWMAMWPLLSEEEARRELGLPACGVNPRTPDAAVRTTCARSVTAF